MSDHTCTGPGWCDICEAAMARALPAPPAAGTAGYVEDVWGEPVKGGRYFKHTHGERPCDYDCGGAWVEPPAAGTGTPDHSACCDDAQRWWARAVTAERALVQAEAERDEARAERDAACRLADDNAQIVMAATDERDAMRRWVREVVAALDAGKPWNASAAALRALVGDGDDRLAAAEAEVRRLSGELASLRDGARGLAEEIEGDRTAHKARRTEIAARLRALLGEDGGTR